MPTTSEVTPGPLIVAPVAATTDPAAATRPSRRTVLRTAGLTAVVGGAGIGLAACGAEETPTAPATSAAAPTTSAAAPTSAASSSAPAGGPSVAAADVPVGGGVILTDAKYVVTQPTEGQFKAFTSTCTHMGCTVGRVEADQIMCPCHGSRFSISDGSVTNGPATKPLEEFEVTVSGDQVTVAG